MRSSIFVFRIWGEEDEYEDPFSSSPSHPWCHEKQQWHPQVLTSHFCCPLHLSLPLFWLVISFSFVFSPLFLILFFSVSFPHHLCITWAASVYLLKRLFSTSIRSDITGAGQDLFCVDVYKMYRRWTTRSVKKFMKSSKGEEHRHISFLLDTKNFWIKSWRFQGSIQSVWVVNQMMMAWRIVRRRRGMM